MYDYKNEKSKVLTDEGQRILFRLRDKVKVWLAEAGCFRMEKAMEVVGVSSSWTQMAYVDRLVEIGEIVDVSAPGTAGQDRIFVAKR